MTPVYTFIPSYSDWICAVLCLNEHVFGVTGSCAFLLAYDDDDDVYWAVEVAMTLIVVMVDAASTEITTTVTATEADVDGTMVKRRISFYSSLLFCHGIGCNKWRKTLACLLVLPRSQAKIVRCGGLYDPQRCSE